MSMDDLNSVFGGAGVERDKEALKSGKTKIEGEGYRGDMRR